MVKFYQKILRPDQDPVEFQKSKGDFFVYRYCTFLVKFSWRYDQYFYVNLLTDRQKTPGKTLPSLEEVTNDSISQRCIIALKNTVSIIYKPPIESHILQYEFVINIYHLAQ